MSLAAKAVRWVAKKTDRGRSGSTRWHSRYWVFRVLSSWIHRQADRMEGDDE